MHGGVGSHNSALLQQTSIALGVLLARFIPLVQMLQFDAQDGCLQSVEAAIIATEHVPVFFFLSVVSQHLKSLRHSLVVCYHYAPVAVCAQVLTRIKTERGSVA